MDELNTHFLYPAALFASKLPHRVSTILGSCVAVCLFDPVLKIGGINHFMLPFWNGQGLASPKYGNIAIERLLEKMLTLGSQKKNLTAKVFGGGEVIETNISQFHIGERNIQIAIEMLDELRIPVVAKSLGGKLGRKIEYNTGTGEVKQKYIERSITLK
ncbi:MAG TPA: chemotaxis protein CheD [Tenuifilaceae bacterium]|nr:chemotaxis protein CheD [Tenuifilaceae bacterium]HPE17137.1 chemotaxis protein CheD [Tenuifilaceae bacterium]HPJ45865.1 chemotaxis protein CheD [Tenuifilaceae bacterium]HPQ34104.1 chemotaxis protein CheD [Tenuifilaceae bacterium]HRX68725.1 chemotaxis protein CheD [Tenuifilaceae bacterium]